MSGARIRTFRLGPVVGSPEVLGECFSKRSFDGLFYAGFEQECERALDALDVRHVTVRRVGPSGDDFGWEVS